MTGKNFHRNRAVLTALSEYLAVCRERGLTPDLPAALVVLWLGGEVGQLPDFIDDPSNGPGRRGWAHFVEAFGFLQGQHRNA